MEPEILALQEGPASAITQKKRTLREKISWFLLEITAPIIWLYVLAKVFVFDIDRWIISQTAPQLLWLLDLKLFILLGAVALLWLALGNKEMLAWFLYILFYPIVLIFKIGWLIFKQNSWTFFFAIINYIISSFQSFKYNFISAAVFFTALVLIFNTKAEYVLWGATIVLLTIIVATYLHEFWMAIKPSSVFQLYMKFFSGTRKLSPASFAVHESIRGVSITNMDSSQLQKWTETLQLSVLYNRACLFSAHKLRAYQNSGLQIIPSIFTILSLTVFTALAFAGIYLGLYKIDSTLFTYVNTPNFFTFFYLSFNSLFFNGISGLEAVSPLSQTVVMLQWFSSLILLSIFGTILLSIRSERNSEEMDKVIKGIEEEGAAMEGFIREEYKLDSIGEAISELERLKSGLVSFIYKMTNSM